MDNRLDSLLSHSARRMRTSEVRELLKLLNSPEMISFAGGLPNPEAFPVDNLKVVVDHVLAEHAREALQYGVTEGHNKLRDAIARGMDDVYGAPQAMNNILITAGSQQALNLLGQIFLDPGDLVLTESPTYLAALQVFQAFQARAEGIALDGDGLDVDALEEKLRLLCKQKALPKFIYAIPNFQNPTGVTLSRPRRERLTALLEEYDLLLVEDDPYGLLRFEGEREPLLKSLAPERVIYLGSFSKILAPGFRIGWIAAPADIINRLSLAKQAQDLCTNTFGQYCVYEAIHHDRLFPHVAEIIKLYKSKRDLMLQSLAAHFPGAATWSRPRGGMFIWVTLPAGLNALDLLPRAIERNVAYVTGAPFFPGGGGESSFRLNFSYSSDDQIREGIRRLGQVIAGQMQSQTAVPDTEGMEIF